MNKNKLIARYQSYNETSQRKNAHSNPLLSSIPTMKNQQDPYLQQKLYTAKLEQLQKANSTSDLSVSEEQLREYIICPLKITKEDPSIVESKHTERKNDYTLESLKRISTLCKNIPYKTISDGKNIQKDFKNQNELILHTVTEIDRDKIKLLDQFLELEKILDLDTNEIKRMFPDEDEEINRQNFEYVQKFKYRIKYNPRDFNDLKRKYQRKQNKIKEKYKQIENHINEILDGEEMKNFTEEEKQLLRNATDEISDEIKKSQLDMKESLKLHLEEQFGKKKYDKLMEHTDLSEIIESITNDEIEEKNSEKEDVTQENTQDKMKEKTQKKITVKTLPKPSQTEQKTEDKSEDTNSEINAELLFKYKRRMMKPKNASE